MSSYKIRREVRRGIKFVAEDIKVNRPDGPFHFILCRNACFMYFEEKEHNNILSMFMDRLVPGGFLMIGQKERLPKGHGGLETFHKEFHIYRKPAESQIQQQVVATGDAAQSVTEEAVLAPLTSESQIAPEDDGQTATANDTITEEVADAVQADN